jgi:fructose-1-phosphate kinase PfkB-like protein
MGEEGACFFTQTDSVKANITEKIGVKGTIGAGDAMTAAYAIALHENMNFEDTVKLCIASATASVMEDGTVPGTLENVEKLLPHVNIEEIK